MEIIRDNCELKVNYSNVPNKNLLKIQYYYWFFLKILNTNHPFHVKKFESLLINFVQHIMRKSLLKLIRMWYKFLK